MGISYPLARRWRCLYRLVSSLSIFKSALTPFKVQRTLENPTTRETVPWTVSLEFNLDLSAPAFASLARNVQVWNWMFRRHAFTYQLTLSSSMTRLFKSSLAHISEKSKLALSYLRNDHCFDSCHIFHVRRFTDCHCVRPKCVMDYHDNYKCSGLHGSRFKASISKSCIFANKVQPHDKIFVSHDEHW